jgi:hypothetical protein
MIGYIYYPGLKSGDLLFQQVGFVVSGYTQQAETIPMLLDHIQGLASY